MNINNELLEKINKAKAEQQAPMVSDNGILPMDEWFKHIRTAPRTADKKEQDDYQEKLMVKGIIDRPVEEKKK